MGMYWYERMLNKPWTNPNKGITQPYEEKKPGQNNHWLNVSRKNSRALPGRNQFGNLFRIGSDLNESYWFRIGSWCIPCLQVSTKKSIWGAVIKQLEERGADGLIEGSRGTLHAESQWIGYHFSIYCPFGVNIPMFLPFLTPLIVCYHIAQSLSVPFGNYWTLLNPKFHSI